MTRLSYSDFRKLLLIHAAALADGRLDDAQDLEQVAETIDGQFDASWSEVARENWTAC
ncbi:hypothetical protein VQ045_18315 [Aurantimonas sp. E1-2-R+4]|uniref:hypothetical protein n=1 Tax=Aurantimonas sp. E1-2-R+4 TaxID=3113714 RepID=UPI002F93F24D